MMTYRGKKHKKDTKDQSLDESDHTKGKSERRLGLGGKTLNLVCLMLSFQCFGNDKKRCPGPNGGKNGAESPHGELAGSRSLGIEYICKKKKRK